MSLRTRILITTVLYGVFYVVGFPETANNEKNDKWAGFRDLKWGDDIKGITGMVLIDEDGDDKLYKRPTDDLFIGEAQLHNIEYLFYKDRFWAVVIKIIGYSNFEALKNATDATFGIGYRSNKYIEEYFWFHEGITMGLQYNEFNKTGELHIINNALSNERENDKKEKAKEAYKDF